jgi:hypothetical protein
LLIERNIAAIAQTRVTLVATATRTSEGDVDVGFSVWPITAQFVAEEAGHGISAARHVCGHRTRRREQFTVTPNVHGATVRGSAPTACRAPKSRERLRRDHDDNVE